MSAPATLLVRLVPPKTISFAARRALLRFCRRLEVGFGFAGWQLFRSMDTAGDLLLVCDFDDEAVVANLEQRERAAAEETARSLGWGLEWLGVALRLHDRRLGDHHEAQLAWLGRQGEPARVARRDSSMGVAVLAAPDTLRVHTVAAPNWTLTRIDFATEAGRWGFVDSPLAERWSAEGQAAGEAGAWAIDLPRWRHRLPELDLRELPPAGEDPEARVELLMQADTLTAHLYLRGRLGAEDALRCERSCEILIAGGYRQLTVDLSELQSVSPDVLELITHTAQRIKARGGQFVLTDDPARLARLLRQRHLEESLG